MNNVTDQPTQQTSSSASVSSQMNEVVKNISTVIKGKEEVVKKLLISIAAGGHVLLHDVPGVGKTLLARTLAKSIDSEFRRVQFTPDLLPTDITGVSIFHPEKREFEFQQGPIFTNIFLADEINRSSPKTQSALLEAMEEKQVSVDNTTYNLDKPFLVIATQNPVEHDGTYPLPTAQLDRFMMRLELGYPEPNTEIEIIDLNLGYAKPVESVNSIVGKMDIIEWQKALTNIHVSSEIKTYAVSLSRATRESDGVKLGVSPRSTVLLVKAAQGSALIHGRDYVIPDDIHYVIKEVFSHRIDESGSVGEAVVKEILEKVKF